MPLRIVHCADIHIGASHSTLGDKAAARAAEVLHSLRAVTLCCREQNADVLLIAGDLFDTPCPNADSVQVAMDYLAELEDTEIFIVAGNHDYLTPSSPYMKDWGKNVHIFREDGCFEGDNFRVFGVSFRHPFEDAFTLPTAPQDEKINILLMHGDTAGGPYNPLREQKIAATGMDYVALGHTHAPSGVCRAGRVSFAYSGSLEPLGFDETGDRGVLAGTLYKGGAELDFVPLARRVCREMEIEVSHLADNAALERLLRDELSPYERDMVKIILTGECDFRPNLPLLKTALEDAVFHLRIKDRTYPSENLELIRNERTLKGIFTDKMLKIIANSEGEEKLRAEQALRLGLAAFAGREVAFRED